MGEEYKKARIAVDEMDDRVKKGIEVFRAELECKSCTKRLDEVDVEYPGFVGYMLGAVEKNAGSLMESGEYGSLHEAEIDSANLILSELRDDYNDCSAEDMLEKRDLQGCVETYIQLRKSHKLVDESRDSFRLAA